MQSVTTPCHKTHHAFIQVYHPSNIIQHFVIHYFHSFACFVDYFHLFTIFLNFYQSTFFATRSVSLFLDHVIFLVLCCIATRVFVSNNKLGFKVLDGLMESLGLTYFAYVQHYHMWYLLSLLCHSTFPFHLKVKPIWSQFSLKVLWFNNSMSLYKNQIKLNFKILKIVVLLRALLNQLH